MYEDKTCARLRDNSARDKILEGRLSRQQCDDKKVFRFLKLLKVPIDRGIEELKKHLKKNGQK